MGKKISDFKKKIFRIFQKSLDISEIEIHFPPHHTVILEVCSSEPADHEQNL